MNVKLFLPGLLIQLALSSYTLHGQIPVGTWRDHFSYSHALAIEETEESIFCITSGGLFYLNFDDHAVHPLSKVQGLSDNGVAALAYSKDLKTLVIAYQNTNVDLLRDNTITNISDILRKTLPGIKRINKIRFIDNFAYLATSFGIVVLDPVRNEIKDTYTPGLDGNPVEIFDIIFFDNNLYAATASGLFRAPAGSPDLVYFGTWERINNIPGYTQTFHGLETIGNYLITVRTGSPADGDSVFFFNKNTWQPLVALPGKQVRSLRTSRQQLLISFYSSLLIFDTNLNLLRTVDDLKTTSTKIHDALIDRDGILRIANQEGGLFSTEDFLNFSSTYPNGPYTNDVFSLEAWEGHVAVAGGGRDAAWNNIFRNGMIYFFENGEWHSVIDQDIRDVVGILPDPINPERVYAATWGYGIQVYENRKLIKTWNESNSSLQSIIPGSPFVRIGGMAFDADHNLWVTNTGVQSPISVKTVDNTWISLPYGSLINAPTIGNILVTETGIKWIQLPRGYGLFVFDDNHTPENINDDRYRKLSVIDQDGQTHNDVYCITKDQSGYIWVGTSQGPLAYFSPDRVFDESEFNAQRILVPRNDGSGLADYLLSTEKINAIAVDGADRKWFGTEKAGSFLISPDGTERISVFNTHNSPMPSDLIYSISIEPNSGEVFFATGKGIVSYRGYATQSHTEMNRVYAFPNPVRPGYQGIITITGLAEDVSVKITDIAGNLVSETRSLGGQAFWNAKDSKGNQVNTGVYLVFITNDDGTQTQVTKILVVR